MVERVLKVNELIKKELGQILLKELDFSKNILATITRVETTSNLIQSKVYVSVMPEREAANVLGVLQKQVYFLQQKLNQRLKIRPIPKIIFVQEKETARAAKVEEILQSLKKEER